MARRGRPVARKKLVWKVYWDALNVTMPIIAQDGVGDNGGFVSMYLVDSSELEALDDELVVKRVVGDIHFLMQGYEPPTSISEWCICWHMLIEKIDTTTTQYANTPTNAQDQPWMWLRVMRGTGSQISVEGGNVDTGPPAQTGSCMLSTHIDIRVARKMEQGDCLKLKWFIWALAPYRCRASVNLRTLVEA